MGEPMVAKEGIMGWGVGEPEDWTVAGQRPVVELTHPTLSVLKLWTEWRILLWPPDPALHSQRVVM